MLIKSGLATQVSGSLGGITGSHNSAGMYLRSRTMPVNPASAAQVEIRNHVAALTSRWNDTLDAAQRDGWETYAVNVTVQGKLGDPITISGQNMYVRSNVPRLQAGLPRVDDAPSTFDLGSFTDFTPLSDEPSQAINLPFDDSDAWVDEDDAALLVQASRPQNPGINFFNGPWRKAGQVDGDSASPPTSPATVDVPFPVVAGQALFVRMRVTRADGRLSGVARHRLIVQ